MRRVLNARTGMNKHRIVIGVHLKIIQILDLVITITAEILMVIQADLGAILTTKVAEDGIIVMFQQT